MVLLEMRQSLGNRPMVLLEMHQSLGDSLGEAVTGGGRSSKTNESYYPEIGALVGQHGGQRLQPASGPVQAGQRRAAGCHNQVMSWRYNARLDVQCTARAGSQGWRRLVWKFPWVTR